MTSIQNTDRYFTRRRLFAAVRFSALILGVAQVAGCAFLNRNNTPTFNLVEKHLWPESKGAREAAFPFIFPIGFIAVMADAFIVHPATVIDDAAADTLNALWDDLDFDEKYMTEMAVLPWRTVSTPIVFVACFMGRSAFDIPARARKTRERGVEASAMATTRSQIEAAISKARALHSEGEFEAAFDELNRVAAEEIPARSDLKTEFDLLFLRTAYRVRRADIVNRILNHSTLWRGNKRSGEFAAIVDEIARGDDPYLREMAISAELSRVADWKNAHARFQQGIKDSNPIIRAKTLEALRGRRDLRSAEHSAEIQRDLEMLAASESDEYVRSAAVDWLAELKQGGPAPRLR